MCSRSMGTCTFILIHVVNSKNKIGAYFFARLPTSYNVHIHVFDVVNMYIYTGTLQYDDMHMHILYNGIELFGMAQQLQLSQSHSSNPSPVCMCE